MSILGTGDSCIARSIHSTPPIRWSSYIIDIYHSPAQSQVARSLIYKLAHKLHPHLAGELEDRFRGEGGNVEAARIFTTLVQAKRRRREAWVEYYPLNRAEASRWRIRPYRFVSNPLSDGFYVLCDGSRDGGAYISLSLKLDRIQAVQLSDERFDIADIARFQADFGRSWGVWSSARDPVPVVLRFEPRHYDRLLESIWHPTQQIHTDADGYVIFRVEVSEPQEMAPFIRSWGSGVVVEEPEQLRRRIMRSLRRQVRNYGLSLDSRGEGESMLHLLWAKRDPRGKPKAETTAWHPLVYHLLDVAAVACCMWDDVLGAGQKAWLGKLLDLNSEPTRQLLALLASLHDIGKATPGFQKKALDLYDSLIETDAGLREKHINCDDHGILSAVILRRWLMDDMGVDKMRAGQLAAVIGGHHGDWISANARQAARAAIGKEKWKDLQKELIVHSQATLEVDAIRLPEDPESFNVFAAFLSGFVSVCDWVGSNADFFDYEEGIVDSKAYFRQALEHAKTALHELGFIGWEADEREPTFSEAFRYLELEANQLQQAAMKHLAGLDKMPRLILVEYLTGGGKTELALHIGDRLLNRFGLSGAYIAMPTMATSNQMFERVKKYLQTRYERRNINLQLAHGQAEQQLEHWQSQSNSEGNESGDAAADWFGQNRKRTLLAPFGVGTIDQAMLSVLQAKHHFVRQYALSQKLVIFDEIHSYDTYMNVIIERLFNWLQALRSPMILLSATLSRQGREDILKAVGAKKLDEMPQVRYPRLTVVEHDGEVRVHPLPRPATRAVQIQRISPDLDSLLAEIRPRYEQGGCIAIVCNTVDESICVARFLREEAAGIDADDVWLFHARFPPVWRKDREDNVLAAFGKDGERPERKILVATQIIEQSLDLDFDLMISSTAPIDLLIQRVGRLHRHEREDRPRHLATPTLLWRKPELSEDGAPDFGVDEVVYERFFLLKTWLKLRDMTALRTPDDVDELMDYVYSDDVEIAGIGEAYRDALAAARDELGLGDANSAFRGKQYAIGVPSDEEMIDSNTFKLKDEEGHASTRDIRPGVDIICIVDSRMASYLDRSVTKAEVDELLTWKLTLRSTKVKDSLDKRPVVDEWRRIAQLRFTRPVKVLDGHFDIPQSKYTLRLTREFGLEIIPKEDS